MTEAPSPPARPLVLPSADLPAAPSGSARPPVRRRSWLEVRWRQFRSAPTPVVRAVAAGVGVATVLGLLLLGHDLALVVLFQGARPILLGVLR